MPSSKQVYASLLAAIVLMIRSSLCRAATVAAAAAICSWCQGHIWDAVSQHAGSNLSEQLRASSDDGTLECLGWTKVVQPASMGALNMP